MLNTLRTRSSGPSFHSMAKALGAFALAAGVLLHAPDADAQFLRRFALRGEFGAGSMLSEFQRSQGFKWGYQLTPRLGFSIVDALAIQVSFSTYGFPSDAGTGRVLMPSAGLRFEPSMRPSGRLFLDANVGLVRTGGLQRVGFDIGLGFEFNVASFLALGPVLRYAQVVQIDTANPGFSADAIFWSGGLSIALRDTRPRVAAETINEDGPVSTDDDRDGVPNAVDRCREEPETRNGFEDDDGCPDSIDRDHDGINNDVDRCPDEGEDRDGFQDEDGCADTDDDNDGIPDLADQCPREPEVINQITDEDGCPDAAPDRDHDGIPDDRDRCSTEPETFNGRDDEDGCPDHGAALVAIEGDQIRINEQINFDNGRATIRGRGSLRVLDAVITILRISPQITHLDIQGHTDDHGDAASNRTLSEQRANTVMQYLVAHGIAAGRLEAHGFGPDHPLVPNTSGRNRRANRRVEFHIAGAPSAAATPAVTPAVTPAATPTENPAATPATPATNPAAEPEETGRHGHHGHHGHGGHGGGHHGHHGHH